MNKVTHDALEPEAKVGGHTQCEADGHNDKDHSGRGLVLAADEADTRETVALDKVQGKYNDGQTHGYDEGGHAEIGLLLGQHFLTVSRIGDAHVHRKSVGEEDKLDAESGKEEEEKDGGRVAERVVRSVPARVPRAVRGANQTLLVCHELHEQQESDERLADAHVEEGRLDRVAPAADEVRADDDGKYDQTEECDPKEKGVVVGVLVGRKLWALAAHAAAVHLVEEGGLAIGAHKRSLAHVQRGGRVELEPRGFLVFAATTAVVEYSVVVAPVL